MYLKNYGNKLIKFIDHDSAHVNFRRLFYELLEEFVVSNSSITEKVKVTHVLSQGIDTPAW